MNRKYFLYLLAVLSGAGLPLLPCHAASEFECLIQPAQIVEIRSSVVGLLDQVFVRRGSPIKKGDLLATVEASVERSAVLTAQYRAQAQGGLQTAQNKLRAATEKARRFRELSGEEFVSAQAADDAEAERKLAESELQTALESVELAKLEHRQSVDQLNRRTLRSPVNGVVVDQYLYPGALVDAADGKKPIMKVAQTNVLLVEANVPFRFFTKVKAGTSVTVIPEPPFSKEIKAKVTTVDQMVDSAAGTFGVVAELDNAKQGIPAGIRCKLRLPDL